MATNQLAKGLASLGRNGDSMLMHVTPREVAGLSQLAKSMGGEITVNPHTGLPEAGFFDFLTNMLPTIAAIALAAPTGGTSLAAVPETMAANIAATTAASAPGLFASMQAAPILGGMATGAAVAGAKGEDPLMGGLMGGISGVGAPSMANAFNKMAAPAAIPAAGGYVNPVMASPGPMAAGAEMANTQLQNASIFNPALSQGTKMAVDTTSSGLSGLPSNAGTNLSNVGKGIGDFAMHPLDTYDKFTKAGGSGSQLALGVGLPALQAMQPEPYDPSADEAKRKAEENKYKDPITGRLNLFQSSPGLRLATGGTVNTNSSSIASGGIQDLYGTNDQTTGTQNLSKDGYGIGRLDNLTSEGSRAKAADTFYAEGGPIAFAEGGSSFIHIPGYNDSKVSVNENVLASGNPLLALLTQMFAKQGLLNAQANTSTSSTPSTPSTPMTIDPLNAPGMYPQAADNYMASNPTDKGTFALQAAKGGYLDGAGDGMSDSIPGTIEGKQPARLADGEFVVPADVVSHLGNGSSKAGAKNLYAMMNKVRKARTGNPKQGKQINPNKYMPA